MKKIRMILNDLTIIRVVIIITMIIDIFTAKNIIDTNMWLFFICITLIYIAEINNKAYSDIEKNS
jgi:hypothetical protein